MEEKCEIKEVRDLFKRVNEWRRGYQPRMTVVFEKNENLMTA